MTQEIKKIKFKSKVKNLSYVNQPRNTNGTIELNVP